LYVGLRHDSPIEQRGPLDTCSALIADLNAILLLGSCATLYFVYHPYTLLCARYLSSARHTPSTEQFLAAASVPEALPEQFAVLTDPYSEWLAVTVVLFVAAALLLYRMGARWHGRKKQFQNS
jgi:hypothetical protein